MDIKRSLRYIWLKLLRMQDTPQRIALGIAIGMFINFSPFVGFHTVLAVIAFFILPINRFSTIAAVWINTPWTVPFLLTMDYKLGAWLLGSQIPWSHIDYKNWHSLLNGGKAIFWPMMTGAMVLGVVGAIVTYYLTLYAMTHYRRQRKEVLLRSY